MTFESRIHGSQRCLGSSFHSKTKHRLKKLFKAPFTRQQMCSVSQFIQVSLNSSYLVKISPDSKRLHGRDAKENQAPVTFFNTGNLSWLSPVYMSVQIRSVLILVQLCCEFTRVNAFTLWHKWIGIYLAKYLSTFFYVLIFTRIDLNRILFLHIASKRIKVIRISIDMFLQFTRVTLQSVNGAQEQSQEVSRVWSSPFKQWKKITLSLILHFILDFRI